MNRSMKRNRHFDQKVLLIARMSSLLFMSRMWGDRWSSSAASKWRECMFRWKMGARGTWGLGSNKAIQTDEMLQNKNINNNQGQACRCMKTQWILASALTSTSGAGWQCDSPGTGWPGFSCCCWINTTAPVNIDKCAKTGAPTGPAAPLRLKLMNF